MKDPETIQETARALIGSELHPIQVEWVQAILAYEHIILPAHRAGYTVAYRVAQKILESKNNV